MNKYLTITIDVEPDCTTNWTYSSPIRFTGVSEGIARRLQPLFNKYDIAPTYLINNVVLENEESAFTLKNLEGKYELGTHLHPEFIEPQKSEFDYAGKKGEANCCFYPPDIEFQKLKSITELFINKIGYPPESFRAGRFSAGNNTIASLEKLGYKVDTSVTPHVIWNDKTREHPVDYRKAPEQPYFISSKSLIERNFAGAILEAPVTISMRKASILKELKRTRFGLRDKIRAERPLWLIPVFSTLPEFIELTKEFEKRYYSSANIFFNMMFHNVEVMPGLSPYTRTEQDCQAYLQQLEKFFAYCSSNQIQSITLKDAYKIYR